MSTHNPGTPVTDDEEWSDETEASPQDAGYEPLQQQYEVLGDGEDDDDQVDNEFEQDSRSAQGPWQGVAENLGDSQQLDVATAMLRAMEAEYRACVESESRITSSDPIVPAATRTETEEALSEENASLEDSGSLNTGQGEAVMDEEKGEVEDEVDAPPRPISPLGQDKAERVMRAMQGFVLAPPTVSAARFEAEWESPDALASLSVAATKIASTEGAPREE